MSRSPTGLARWAIAGAAAVLLVLLFVWWQTETWYRHRLLTDQRTDVELQLAPYGNTLVTTINRRITKLEALAALTRTNPLRPDLDDHFESFAAGLYAGTQGIRTLQIFPIEGPVYVYPVEGNEAVIGRTVDDLINDERPEVYDDVARALQTRRVTLSGPYELRQGGLGLVARLAIYQDDTFLGIAVVIVDVPPILQETGLGEPPEGLAWALRDETGQILTGDGAVFDGDPVIYSVPLPEGTWDLAAVPDGGWQAAIREPLRSMHVVGLLIVGLMTATTYLVIERQIRLKGEVQKRTASLAESQTRYHQLFDGNADALLVLDEAGRIIDANRTASEQYGFTQEELLRLSITDLVPSDFPALPAGTTEFASRHRQKDGAEFSVEVSVRPLKLGGVSHTFVVVRDVTQREIVEMALQASEARFRALVEQSLTGIYILAEDRFLYVNRRFAEMFGYGMDELLTSVRPLELVDPSDRARAAENLRRRFEREQESMRYAVLGRRKNGDPIWIEIHGTRLEIEGRNLIAGAMLDVTERRQAEEAQVRYNQRLKVLRHIDQDIILARSQPEIVEAVLRRIHRLIPCEGSNIALFSEDTTEATSYAVGYGQNQALDWLPSLQAGQRVSLKGNPRIEMLKAGQIINLSDLREAGDLTPDIGEQLLQDGVRAFLIVPLIVQDQLIGVLNLLSNSAGFFTPEYEEIAQEVGNQLAIALHQINLSEQLKRVNAELEERVRERTAQLEAKTQDLETFTYSVSHDLKAPLRGIDGYSRLLLEGYLDQLDEEGQFFVQTIRRATVQMGQLIDDLLAYSRLERRTLRVGDTNLRELIESIIEARADDIRARAVEVRVDVPCATVSVDPDGLAMALRNLLDNALKFTRDAEQPCITVGGRETETTCTLWLQDNGIGFDMQYHDRIFDIFQRLHRSEEYAGTGIGLAIVRKALERLGGRVWAESEPGQGATFYVEVPK